MSRLIPVLFLLLCITAIQAQHKSHNRRQCPDIHSNGHFTLGYDTAICKNGSIVIDAHKTKYGQNLLEGSVGNVYWTPKTGVEHPDSIRTEFHPTVSTLYTLHIFHIESTCCGGVSSWTDSGTLMITVDSTFAPQISEDQSICPGASIQLHASGADQYEWFPTEGLSDPRSAEPVASPAHDMVYTVLCTRGVCQQMLQTKVQVLDAPQIKGASEYFVCADVQKRLEVSGGIKYHWSPASGLSNTEIPNPIAQPVEPTVYSVEVTNEAGCVSTKSVSVTPLPTVALELYGENSTVVRGRECEIRIYGQCTMPQIGRNAFVTLNLPAEGLSVANAELDPKTNRYEIRVDLSSISQKTSLLCSIPVFVKANASELIAQSFSYRAAATERYCCSFQARPATIETKSEQLFDQRRSSVLFPTDASRDLSIHINSLRVGVHKLELFNMLGQRVYSCDIESQSEAMGSYSTIIPAKLLIPGVYQIRLDGTEGTEKIEVY